MSLACSISRCSMVLRWASENSCSCSTMLAWIIAPVWRLTRSSHQATIEATNQPTTYGANGWYHVQNWATIEQLLTPLEAEIMFLKANNGNYYQFVTHQGEPWLWEVAANLTSTIPTSAVILDTPAGGWLNRYAGKIISVV